ncbi:MAG: rod shape-determining protein MreC [Clostridium sp.]|uniref:rod shape-determining protein MreC n=1 Tax=Clostridium sp. TaxID=1506 RepID=UPI00302144B2
MKFLKNKLAVTIIVLSVAFLGLIMFTVSKDNKDIISSGAGSTLSPLQKIVYNVNNGVKQFVDLCLNFSEVQDENKQLEKENTELKNKLVEYNSVIAENERLRESVNFASSSNNYDYLGCNIVGASGSGFQEGYIIDKGSKHGLKKDMVLVASGVLVGQVTSVGDSYSIVQTLINKNSAVSVMVESTRESTGILKGHATRNDEYLTKVTDLPMNSEVKVGDVILTSGLGMVYPKEIRIGEVISVETDDVKVMKSAIVKPYADFDKLEELFVIIPKDTIDVEYR